MTYTWEDLGLNKRGPQFALLDERLTVHGYPPEHVLDTPKDRTQRFQLKQGYTGRGADGLVGPKQWAFLMSDPVPSGIRLDPWKLTLPVGDPGHPREVFPIDEFEYTPWFVQRPDGTLGFRAPVNGVTTSGSSYARCELREMAPKSWSVDDGKHHILAGVCRVTEIPGRKTDYIPGVVFAQDHDPDDDIVILLVDANGRVIVEESLGKDQGSDKTVLQTGYRLGDDLDFIIDAHAGGIDVEINGRDVHLDRLAQNAYGKAGCYLRGNSKNATGEGSVDYLELGMRHAA